MQQINTWLLRKTFFCEHHAEVSNSEIAGNSITHNIHTFCSIHLWHQLQLQRQFIQHRYSLAVSQHILNTLKVARLDSRDTRQTFTTRQ